MFASLEAIRPTNAHQDTFPPNTIYWIRKAVLLCLPFEGESQHEEG